MLLGVQLLSCLLLPLLQRGRGDTEYGDLEDEGHYLYLDEDGPLEVPGGPARCQDTYRDWISLYCWAPFHAALMATPEGSRCRWDQISSTYSELSGCTQLLAQLLSCPWPGAVLDTFFLQVHAEHFTNCTGTEPPGLGRQPPGLGGLPPALAVAVAVALGCLVPLAAALTVRRAQKGARTPAGSCPAPACPRACEGPATAPFPASPGN
ncbi:receptor activity-modifying protein 1-like isoform X2 [Nyctibius grandis]|uniref:receptor activity-modifying protein 1-like isoform X2 n=1 Tax=Nyctibius grandis TaxID=48427 RepID=UPI0035BC3048